MYQAYFNRNCVVGFHTKHRFVSRQAVHTIWSSTRLTSFALICGRFERAFFEVRIANTGDNVIDANVNLALANMQTAKEDKYNTVKVTVYPDATRTVKLSLPRDIAKGKYALAAILDYGHRQPLGGTQMMLEVKAQSFDDVVGDELPAVDLPIFVHQSL